LLFAFSCVRCCLRSIYGLASIERTIPLIEKEKVLVAQITGTSPENETQLICSGGPSWADIVARLELDAPPLE